MTGVNKIRVVNLFFLISILALIVQLSFATFITPNSLNKSRSLIRLSDFDSVSSVIKINDFSDSFKNLTFYVQSKNQNNEMKNIFIRDEGGFLKSLVSSKEKSMNTTVIAKTGFINKKKLILTDGLIQTQDKEGKLNNVSFRKTEILIDALKPRAIIVPKLQETSTFVLFECFKKRNIESNLEDLQNCPKDNLNSEVIVTIARRVGMPFYIPLVSLICSFLLISTREKKYRSLKKYIYFAVCFLILVMAEILVRYSGLSKINTIFYFLFPFILMPIIYLMLIKSLAFERVK